MSAAAPLAFAAAVLAGDVGFHGSLGDRSQLTAPSAESLLSTRDNAILASLFEGNIQGGARLLDEKLRFGVDASAFLLLGGEYADADPDSGALASVNTEDDVSARAFVALSEAWTSVEPIDHLVLTFGKKRTVWGPALAFSATDVLNPARDPTDPSLQRAGFVQARVDAPFELFTVTALWAPAVLEEEDAIPVRVLVDDDGALHYAAALRGYALVGDADVNAWLLWTNQYGDDLENRARLALTLSKSLFTIHEFHAEVLVQQGSARKTVDPHCVDQLRSLLTCARTEQPLLRDELRSSDRILPRILVGWRVMPDDGSMVSLEYLYQADGLLRAEFDDVTRLRAFVGDVQRAGVDVPLAALSGGGDGLPTRVSFQPQRRHYLFFSYTKPQVLDDFTLAFTAITPVEDLSVLASGSVVWQAQEWLQLSLWGFAPLPSPARLSADTSDDPWQALYEAVDPDWRGWVPRGALVDGVPMGELDGAPFQAQVMLEARAYF